MVKYLLFEYDQQGPNNNIIAFKFVVFLAAISERILVIPKAQSIFHLDWGPNSINESKTKFGEITETHLNDFLNLDVFSHLVKMISFEDFAKKEKESLNLPPDFSNFHRKFSDYQTMKIQGSRFRKKEPQSRGLYWSNRRKWMESKGLDNKLLRKQDWIYYSILNFKTLSIKNPSLFMETLTSLDDRVMFLPMDIYFGTNKYKYFRIFGYVNGMKSTVNPIWNDILNVSYFKKDFYTIAEKISKDYLKNEKYDAYHHRFNGGFEHNNMGISELLKRIVKKMKTKILYVSSDSYKKFAQYKKKHSNSLKIKFVSINELKLEKYLPNLKFKPFIEMLMCVNSQVFIGTKNSSFSGEIINIRTKENHHFRELDKISSNKNYVI